jgi:hypothetical protein
MKKSYLERHASMLRAFRRFLKACRKLGASTEEIVLHLEGRISDLEGRPQSSCSTALNDVPRGV